MEDGPDFPRPSHFAAGHSKVVASGICICNPPASPSFFFFLTLFFIYLFFLFLAALGLRCRTRAFSSGGEQGLLLVAVRRLLVVVASLVAEHQL